MSEFSEMPKPTMIERVKMRIEDFRLPTGPVSKEVVRQITKIQSVIPKGEASDRFAEAKLRVIDQLRDKDAQVRKDAGWALLQNLVKLYFFAPIAVLFFPARTGFAAEKVKIRQSGKEWRKHLTENFEGIKLVGAYKGERDAPKIDAIVESIMTGQPPTKH